MLFIFVYFKLFVLDFWNLFDFLIKWDDFLCIEIEWFVVFEVVFVNVVSDNFWSVLEECVWFCFDCDEVKFIMENEDIVFI